MGRGFERFQIWSLTLGVVLAVSFMGAGAASARDQAHKLTSPKSDLNGLWTNASYTRLQRPKALKALVITPEEARAYEATLSKYNGVPSGPDDKLGQVASEFNDSGTGLARIKGQIRTSWIIDPSTGRVPCCS